MSIFSSKMWFFSSSATSRGNIVYHKNTKSAEVDIRPRHFLPSSKAPIN